jgi:tetratricopeptide (TPR) repeat protein
MRRPRVIAPDLPDDVTGGELDKEVRRELSSLSKDAAHDVARHLVMTARLLDDDPELAWQHAVAARDRAARLPSVREAVGLTAYRTQRYTEALAELRTARRLTGSSIHLPVMADCERGLGRPERALALAVSPEAHKLDLEGRAEVLIVAAGARADLGQHDAAVVTLHVPQLRTKAREPWVARLRSAYADALAAVGRHDEAREWLALAAEVDEDGSTGAAERLAELDGVTFLDEDDVDDFEDELDGGGEGEVEVEGEAGDVEHA